jgi:hypothetical protein
VERTYGHLTRGLEKKDFLIKSDLMALITNKMTTGLMKVTLPLETSGV